MNQHPSSQGLMCPTPGSEGDPERMPVLRITGIPTTRIIQRRGETQDTVVIVADGKTYLVRKHIHTVCEPCPLGNFEIRRLDAETPPRM